MKLLYKKIRVLCCLALLPFSAFSQQISTAEYFIDTDPGVGNGMTLTTGAPADTVSFGASVTVPQLGPGYHMLYVRSRSGNGTWSLHKPQRFYVKPQIVAAEYFFDTDPGAGNGTPLGVNTAYDSVSFTGNIGTSGLAAGTHTLYVRTRLNSGQWSLYARRRIFVRDEIVAAEYFYDTDPGPGNGTPIAITAALDSAGFNAGISASGLAPGKHTLYVRTKNGSGAWGLASGRRIEVTNSVVAAEYFFDIDPGPGNGIPYTLPLTGDTVGFTAGLPIPPLTQGWHYLYFRTKDATGRWSMYHMDSIDVLPFTCIPPALMLTGTNASCFQSNDGAISLSATGGTAPFSFLWSGPNNYVSIQQNISNLVPGNYDVTVTATGGCTTTAGIVITEPAAINISLSNNGPICAGDTLHLSGTTNYDTASNTAYTWTGPSGFSAATQNAAVFNAAAAASGDYQLKIVTGNGCTDSAVINAAVYQNTTYYADGDNDGWGNDAQTVVSCTGTPAGYVVQGGDCQDNNPAVHPAAPELCNGIDDDCDNSIDEGLNLVTYYADADNDGYGNAAQSMTTCGAMPGGFVSNNQDCDDADSLEHPGQVWYTDADGDGYGTGNAIIQCSRPQNGYLAGELAGTGGDCNDNNANIHPGTTSLGYSGSTGFSSTLVSPLTGSQYTSFQFEVIYTDSNNQLPPAFYPRVLLDHEGNGIYNNVNDRTIVMTETDVTDVNTADGKRYTASINGLATGTAYQTSVIVADGGCITEAGPYNYPDVLVQPDLEIFANDISFSSPNPDTASSLTVSAVVHNNSDYFAQNFMVHLRNQYDTAVQYPDVTISSLAPHASTTVSWNITTPSVPAWCPMEVTIDYTNTITETNELNNSAIRPFINGNYNLPGGINAYGTTGQAVAYTTQQYIGLSGSAYYYGTPVPLVDSGVSGATVSYTILETGASYSTYTNAAGFFSTSFPSPGIAGTYHIQGTITDFTLTGTFTAEFTLVPPVVTVCNLPNLSVGYFLNNTGVQNNPGLIVAGNAVSGFVKVTNTGTGATTGSTVLELSQSGGSPFTATSITVPPLAPGASYNHNFGNIVFSTPGSYSLCALADADSTENECNEFNNYGCAGITVLPALPDIYPYWGPGGTTHLCNAQAPSFTLYNGGGAAAGSFACSLVVKKDGVVLDTLYHTVSGIASLQFHNLTIPYTYPGAGSYSLQLICDGDDIIAETNETNNGAIYQVNILNCLPDLYLAGCEALDVTPADPVPGDSITLTATLFNGGNAPATGPVSVSFSLSGGGTYAVNYPGSISPNASATVSIKLPGVAAGQRLTAYADPANNIIESQEANNGISDFMCYDFQPVPKCVLESNFWMQSWHVGAAMVPNIGVQAAGLYDAAQLKVRFLVSGPGINGTVNLGDATVSNMEKTCGCPAVAVLPSNFVFGQSGTYTFTMITDPDNLLTECSEGNNVLVKHVTVSNLPDMRILSQHIAPSKLNPEPGEPITMNISYGNIGQANINDQMKLRVMVDNTPIDSIYPVTGLVTGGTTTYALPASWSSMLTGIHVIRAFIDADDQINESNEMNNEASRAIVVGQAANLYFQNFTASNMLPALNDTVQLMTRIGNNGDLGCAADISFFYLNDQLDTITAGTVHVTVPANDSLGIQLPWKVSHPSTVIGARIINASVLEFTYDDNMVVTGIGGPPSVTLTATTGCTNGANGSLNATVAGGKPPYTFSWSNGQTSQSLSAAAGSYTLVVTDLLNRKDTVTGTITAVSCCPVCTKAPKKPALQITGTSSIGTSNKFCPGDTITVSVKIPDTMACSYTWTAPAGATILSGQGTPSVLVYLDTSYTLAGNMTAYAQNSCGTSATALIKIQRGSKPAMPSVILGDKYGLCGISGIPYSVTNVAGLSYNWYFDPVNEAAAAATVATGQGTHAVTIDFTNSWVKGTIHVTAAHACGVSGPRKLTSVTPAPNKPAQIYGPSLVQINATGVGYSIDPVFGATSYTWTSPSGSTISDGITTSASNMLTTTSDTVSVNFGKKNGYVKVKANNSCGSGATISKLITVTSSPVKPGDEAAAAGTVDDEAAPEAYLDLYPNPASTEMQVSFFLPEAGSYQLKVMDVTGRELIAAVSEGTEGSNKITVEVSRLVPGVYHLSIHHKAMTYTAKFVVE